MLFQSQWVRIQGSQHLGKISEKSEKIKKSEKTQKAQRNFLENQSIQGKISKNLCTFSQLDDAMTMFGHISFTC